MKANLAVTLRNEDAVGDSETDAAPVDRCLNTAMSRAAHVLESDPLQLPIAFSFCWRERVARVEVLECEDGTTLRLSMRLGAIPFTAEDPTLRTQINYVVSRNGDLPLGRFLVDERQEAIFEAEIALEGRLTSTLIVTTVVLALLRVSAYLDLARPL